MSFGEGLMRGAQTMKMVMDARNDYLAKEKRRGIMDAKVEGDINDADWDKIKDVEFVQDVDGQEQRVKAFQKTDTGEIQQYNPQTGKYVSDTTRAFLGKGYSAGDEAIATKDARMGLKRQALVDSMLVDDPQSAADFLATEARTGLTKAQTSETKANTALKYDELDFSKATKEQRIQAVQAELQGKHLMNAKTASDMAIKIAELDLDKEQTAHAMTMDKEKLALDKHALKHEVGVSYLREQRLQKQEERANAESRATIERIDAEIRELDNKEKALELSHARDVLQTGDKSRIDELIDRKQNLLKQYGFLPEGVSREDVADYQFEFGDEHASTLSVTDTDGNNVGNVVFAVEDMDNLSKRFSGNDDSGQVKALSELMDANTMKVRQLVSAFENGAVEEKAFQQEMEALDAESRTIASALYPLVGVTSADEYVNGRITKDMQRKYMVGRDNEGDPTHLIDRLTGARVAFTTAEEQGDILPPHIRGVPVPETARRTFRSVREQRRGLGATANQLPMTAPEEPYVPPQSSSVAGTGLF